MKINIAFAESLKDSIITVHVSDYDFVNERHWLPGEGKIDWVKMADVFDRIGYNGVWMYEIGLNCPKTIIRDRKLTIDDFRQNARKIFAREKLESLGRQKENLGMWE